MRRFVIEFGKEVMKLARFNLSKRGLLLFFV